MKNYKKESNMFKQAVKNIIKEDRQNVNQNGGIIPIVYPAIVTAVNGSLADVRIASDETQELFNLKNKSGETLSVSDSVFVLSIGGLTNSYILTKF